MVARLSSFESRRWLVAILLAVGVLALQIVHAARVTGSEVASVPAAPAAPAAPARPAVLVEVVGTVVAVGDGLLAVREGNGAAPVAFAAENDLLVTRDGADASLAALRADDAVRMTVDARAGRILQVRAEAEASAWADLLRRVGPLAAVALVATVLLLAARRGGMSTVSADSRRLAPLARRLIPSHAAAGPRRPCQA